MSSPAGLVVGSFSPFLPQDNTESPETEELVAATSADLAELLSAKPADFWAVVKADPSLVNCIGSYLQFCRRAYDDSPQPVFGLSLARQSLAKHVFLVLFRLVSRENGAGISAAEQAKVLYERWILDIPKLMDIAVLYGRKNPGLTRRLLEQAFQLQPQYGADLANVVPTIVANIADVQQACSNAVQSLQASPSGVTLSGLTDGLIYLRDTCTTLAALADVYPPAARLFLRDGAGLLPLLPLLHDKLLPAAIKAWSALRLQPATAALCLKLQRQLVCLGAEVQHLLYTLLDSAFLRAEDSTIGPVASSSSRRPDPAAQERGQGLLAALQAADTVAGMERNSLLKLTSQLYSLEEAIAAALHQGRIALDTLQMDYLLAMLGSPKTSAAVRTAVQASTSAAKSAERDALLAQIHEVLPGYGKGFLAACLDAAGQDAERVIHQLLEGSLPAELAKLDPQLRLDGNGPKALESPGWASAEAEAADRQQEAASTQRPLAATHKGTSHALQSSSQDRALAKLHAQAAQWEAEYEDEYDDSFDDLAGFDADPNAEADGDKADALPGTFGSANRPPLRQQQQQQHTQPKGGKPLWVLEGRVYNYRKEGATPVPNQAAADEAVRAAQAAAEAIHGLGAGGNKLNIEGGAEQPQGSSSGGGERGRGRGRGHGRGGRAPPADAARAHAFKDVHKAAIGNHHRKDRALRKMGGPAG